MTPTERRSRAARLGWIRSKRRERLQAAILQAIDEYRDEGYTFAVRWPGGAVVDREQIARLFYWKLVQAGVLQGESAIGYAELEAEEVAEAERQISAGLADG